MSSFSDTIKEITTEVTDAMAVVQYRLEKRGLTVLRSDVTIACDELMHTEGTATRTLVLDLGEPGRALVLAIGHAWLANIDLG